jgi:hypothetical protein
MWLPWTGPTLIPIVSFPSSSARRCPGADCATDRSTTCAGAPTAWWMIHSSSTKNHMTKQAFSSAHDPNSDVEALESTQCGPSSLSASDASWRQASRTYSTTTRSRTGYYRPLWVASRCQGWRRRREQAVESQSISKARKSSRTWDRNRHVPSRPASKTGIDWNGLDEIGLALRFQDRIELYESRRRAKWPGLDRCVRELGIETKKRKSRKGRCQVATRGTGRMWEWEWEWE